MLGYDLERPLAVLIALVAEVLAMKMLSRRTPRGEPRRGSSSCTSSTALSSSPHFCHQSSENRQRSFEIITESISPPTTPPIPSRSTWRGDLNTSSFRQRRSKIVEDHQHLGQYLREHLFAVAASTMCSSTRAIRRRTVLRTAVPSYEEIVMTVSDHNPYW